MNEVTDIFAARAATLPLAPRQALCPAFSPDPAIREIHDCLCDLHYLAFRALYGPPPAGVQVRCVHSGLATELLEPRYLATVRWGAGPHELAWLDSFAYGLDHWDEAAMVNPCIFTPAAGPFSDRWQVTLMPMAEVLVGAGRRLSASQRWREAENLSDAWRELFGGRQWRPGSVGKGKGGQRGCAAGEMVSPAQETSDELGRHHPYGRDRE